MKRTGAGFASRLTIRPLASLAEYQACTELQEEVWGRGFSERVPPAILMLANRIGGLSAGAFDREGRLHAFVFGLTGIREGRRVHWSDMLAVRRELRDQGLGTRLKRYQREVLLDRGVEWMHWTFDPLQARNAHVNLRKLGVTAGEYVPHMYGETDSPLHRGVGTDRLVVTWDLASARVEAALSSHSRSGAGPGDRREIRRILETGEEEGLPVPLSPVLGLDDPRLLLSVPSEIDGIMHHDLALAIRWREMTRAPFVHYLGRGYRVEDFRREGLLSTYLLVKGGVQGGTVREKEGD